LGELELICRDLERKKQLMAISSRSGFVLFTQGCRGNICTLRSWRQWGQGYGQTEANGIDRPKEFIIFIPIYMNWLVFSLRPRGARSNL